ncbi:uncharacterized protein LOC111634242 [Centruroides sculpturatus]|uniref:uncharacterized protein LOC111634242 n=1 Tax=Centruroides sculpturatus TaxID=218467 RepID=UPI000C6DB824|nr:uncharacterized protein LOC111634242 [Centruroides sculpturatus]
MCSPRANLKRRHLNFKTQLSRSAQPTSTVSKFFSLFSKLTSEPEPECKEYPKCLMFGPGLETSGLSCIARKIISSHSSMFNCVGMQNDAITVKYENELLGIFFLYSNTKVLRRPLPVSERLTHNKLFLKTAELWQLIDPAKNACKNASAFVYVIDGNAEIENVDDPFPDLMLILNYKLQTLRYGLQNVDQNTPTSQLCLLVLALVPNETSPRQDLQHIIESLNLWKYNIPWQICLVSVECLKNLSLGFDWMMAHLRSLNS